MKMYIPYVINYEHCISSYAELKKSKEFVALEKVCAIDIEVTDNGKRYEDCSVVCHVMMMMM
jgi:hypothetical protein